MTTDDILAAAAEQMSDELPAARAFVSPQPKGGRTNAHVRFGPNATPRVQKIAEGGLWIASVGYAADGSASLTLLDKASDAAEWDEAGEWTEEEWASWEVDQYASWEETHAEAWEAENGCYPWQFEEAAEAKGTPQPPGGRVNSHVRFGDDADEEEAIEDEEEAMEYDYDYGDGIDEDEEEVEAFGEVGVLSTVKGAAPTPVATFNGGESLDAALGSATPFVPGSGMRQMRIRTRESHASRATSASEVSRGLASIAKSYADADEAEEEMEQEKMGESDAEEVELADDDEDDDGDLPVQKLFGTPIPEAMEEAVTLAGTFAVSTEPSTEAVVTTNCATPAKTPKSSTKGAAKTPKSGRKSGNGREEGLPTLGSLSKSAGKSAGLRSGAKCPPPLENGEQLVRGTFTPLVLHEPTDVASGASSRRLVGIFTPAEEDAEMQSVFPLGMSARKGDKGKSSSSRLPAAADTEDEPKAKCASELTLRGDVGQQERAARRGRGLPCLCRRRRGHRGGRGVPWGGAGCGRAGGADGESQRCDDPGELQVCAAALVCTSSQECGTPSRVYRRRARRRLCGRGKHADRTGECVGDGSAAHARVRRGHPGLLQQAAGLQQAIGLQQAAVNGLVQRPPLDCRGPHSLRGPAGDARAWIGQEGGAPHPQAGGGHAGEGGVVRDVAVFVAGVVRRVGRAGVERSRRCPDEGR